jgi:hypothetical protein
MNRVAILYLLKEIKRVPLLSPPLLWKNELKFQKGLLKEFQSLVDHDLGL